MRKKARRKWTLLLLISKCSKCFYSNNSRLNNFKAYKDGVVFRLVSKVFKVFKVFQVFQVVFQVVFLPEPPHQHEQTEGQRISCLSLQ